MFQLDDYTCAKKWFTTFMKEFESSQSLVQFAESLVYKGFELGAVLRKESRLFWLGK